MSAAAVVGVALQPAAFDASRDRFEAVVGWLDDAEAAGLAHGELEARLEVDSRELFRQLFQDHLDLRAVNETRLGSLAAIMGVAGGSLGDL